MTVIRTTRFEVAPGDVEEMLARRHTLVEAVRRDFPGLTAARLSRVGDQVWIDDWRWESAAAMAGAQQAAAAGRIPEAAAVHSLTSNVTAESAELVDERWDPLH